MTALLRDLNPSHQLRGAVAPNLDAFGMDVRRAAGATRNRVNSADAPQQSGISSLRSDCSGSRKS